MISDQIDDELLARALRLSLQENDVESSKGLKKENTTGKQKKRAEMENSVFAAKAPMPSVDTAPDNSESKCIGCFGKGAGSQAPCGCKYCPDCLAGIFILALEAETFCQPQCCGRLLPIELAAPILQQAGIWTDTNTLDTEDADGRGKGKSVAVGKAPPETKVDCLICMEKFNAKDTIQTPCQHHYCHDCMKRLFVESTKNESLYPPKCCDKDIPLIIANIVLNAQQQMEFTSKGTEFRTKDRLYCSSKRCSAFIHPTNIYRGVGMCRQCQRQTCVSCKMASHNGSCSKDEDTRAMLKLAKKSGWRKCFKCKFMVAIDEGCNHITCKYVTNYLMLLGGDELIVERRCGAEFCYICGAKWRTCRCESWHRDPERVRHRVQPEPGPPYWVLY